MNLNQLAKNSTTIRSARRVFKSRAVQNLILVWLDPQIDAMNDNELTNVVTELERVVKTMRMFIDVDKCFDFITDIKEEKILVIISDELGLDVVSVTHNIPQINAFYIFCKKQSKNRGWVQQWSKVQKISTFIGDICEALKQDVEKYERNSIPISFVSARSQKLGGNLDQLDPTFMYTQILKEILLTIKFNDKHLKEFTKYYRDNFAESQPQLHDIDEFEKDYKNYSPIRWYTYECCCVYSMLNQALRLMEVDTIIKMGFFIHDLHNEIARLDVKECSQRLGSKEFIIYRGQHLSKTDFDRMRETQGGLISFNSFLSTTRDPAVALRFARSSLDDSDTVGIIFVMTIDPSIKSTPFASIDDVSHYKLEEEILFSMHTVFRIDNIIKSPDDKRLWQVDLIQSNDNDSQLNELTERIREEIQGSTEWDRLGKLLIRLGEFSKADELYQILLDQTDDDRKKVHLYNQLGWTKKKQKQYQEALVYYEKSLEIKQNLPSVDPHSLTATLNEIGSAYQMMNENSKALLYYEKALTINQNAPFPDESDLALSYSRIGSVYEKMGEYLKALSFHEDAIEIRQEMQPIDYINLAYCYSNMGSVYKNMGNFSEAISVYEKALACQQEVLPSNHPELAHSYTSISFVYDKMGQHDKARQFKQRAIAIGERSLPNNHPHLQSWRKSLKYKSKNYE